MKRKDILGLICAAALAIPFCSCSEDSYDGRPDDGSYKGDVAYMSVSLVFTDDTMNPTRAQFDGSESVTDKGYFFNNGINAESRICEEYGSNWLLAYNASNQMIATLPLTSISSGDLQNDNTGKSYTAVCEMPANSNFIGNIAYMRVILNASSTLQAQIADGASPDNMTLSQSAAGNYDYLFRTSGSNRYHTMTSSMVVKNGAAAPALTMNEIVCYPSKQQAMESPCATLYVERLQSKYTVLFHPETNVSNDKYFLDRRVMNYNPSTEISSAADNDVILFSPVSTRRLYYVNSFDINSDNSVEVNRGYWRASIVGWDINGTEKSEYLFKSFGNSPAGFTSWNLTPTGLSSPVRNLWASDPTYSNPVAAYPDQYRDAWDDESSVGAGKIRPYQGSESAYTLNYISFNNLSTRDIRRYSSENTYDAQAVFRGNRENLVDRLQYRCGNHIIIGAQLLIEGMDDAGVYNATSVDNNGLVVSGSNRVTTKYFMDNIYWSEQAYINYYCKYMADNLDATTPCISDLSPIPGDFIPNDVFTPMPSDLKFYVYDSGAWRLADYRDFSIQPVYIVGGDGWCYPMPASNPNNPRNTVLYIRQADDSYRQVTVDEYNKLAYGFPFFFAKCYNEGRMYYSVPVSGSENQSSLNFGLTTGDFGAVRNHWYHYRFTSLSSVGIPVHNPDQPIVPNKEPSILGLSFEVRIIPWHIVDEEVNI